MSLVRKISKILTDYCENSSLCGLGYICNQKIHLTERLFWLVCIIISAGGSYYLIRDYQNSFESNSISLVLEGTRPQDKTELTAIGVCEMGIFVSHRITKYIKGLYEAKGDTDYIGSDDIEDFVQRIVFPNLYSAGSLPNYCTRFAGCTDCVHCPHTGYKEIAESIRMNCSELIIDCIWNGKPFDCCKYFLPLQSPNGRCFIMNSIQTTYRNSPNWLKTEFDWATGKGELLINLAGPTMIHLLNAEDIPFFLVKGPEYELRDPGYFLTIQSRLRPIINDPSVRDIAPEYRKCRFPDEKLQNFSYDQYSFKACISDCLKRVQIKACGCTSYNYLTKSNDLTPSCDYDGYMCLDKKDIILPPKVKLQPWLATGLGCKCWPSCTDHQISVFEKSISQTTNASLWTVRITQSVATEQFRRQAVRTRLDVVVTIGGILGLFMGASILSGVEIIYFFLIRIFNTRN